MGRGKSVGLSAVCVQRRVAAAGIPSGRSLRRWAQAALDGAAGELTLRIVDEVEGRELNQRYRGKDAPTNVLSFPYEFPDLGAPVPLGDVVICAPVVAREAEVQGKLARAHWAHLVIHGCLHVLGYDHVEEREAARMEARERVLMAALGFPDPYATEVE